MIPNIPPEGAQPKSNAPQTRLETWQAFVASLTWKSGYLDESTYVAFLRAASLEIEGGTARTAVLARLAAARAAPIRPEKIESQLLRAYAYVRGWHAQLSWAAASRPRRGGLRPARRKSPNAEIDFEVVDYIVQRGPSLTELLAGPLEWPRPAASGEPVTELIIDQIFPGNPLLCAAVTQQLFLTKTREQWRGQLGVCQFIVPSPMKARLGKVKNSERRSAHTLDNTGRRRFLVVEFDFKEIDDDGRETRWSRLIREWKGDGKSVFDAAAALLFNLTTGTRAHPLSLLVHSGNKSYIAI